MKLYKKYYAVNQNGKKIWFRIFVGKNKYILKRGEVKLRETKDLTVESASRLIQDLERELIRDYGRNNVFIRK